MAGKTVDTDLNVTGTVNATTLQQGGVGVVPVTTLSGAGKGVVVHGSNASMARPTGFASIEWQGSVQPTNSINGDTWIDTTT